MRNHSNRNGSCKVDSELRFNPDGSPIPPQSEKPNRDHARSPKLDSEAPRKAPGSGAAERGVGFAELADGSLLETIDDRSDKAHTLLPCTKTIA